VSLRIVDVDPQSGDALSLLREAAIEARALYPDAVLSDAPWPTNAPSGARGAYVVAYLDQQPVACGALREIDLVCAEVRRMYVVRERRRHRIGYAVLSHLVAEARRLGYRRLRLETGHKQAPAMALYEAFGFRRISPFGKYENDPTSVCFELLLVESAYFSHRLATSAELPELRALMDVSIRTFIGAILDPARVDASFDIMGVDTQLIEDGTYFVVECEGRIAGCGGWSRRATMFGGDHSAGRDARHLDPATEPARVRAMYTHPDFARRGIGRLVLSLCEAAAAQEGFQSLELVATVAGEPLYTACGFSLVERFEVPTSKAVTVPCARMAKRIDGGLHAE
jgi:GNAT superfamily N-acetyltransferase